MYTINLPSNSSTKVETLKDAQAQVSALNKRIGSSQFYCRSNVGNVYDSKGCLLAKISYNARVWGLDGEEIIIS